MILPPHVDLSHGVTALGLFDAQQCRNGGRRGVGRGQCLVENYASEFKAPKKLID